LQEGLKVKERHATRSISGGGAATKMERIPFIFTICFVLLGPVKIIPAFAQLTREADPGYRRRLALLGTLIATALCLLVVALGEGLVSRYELSLQALQLGGGLVLLVSALNVIFPRVEPKPEQKQRPSALQLAIAPLATPIIVAPAGIAALLIFVMAAPAHPGMHHALGLVLVVILALDLLVMLFNAPIVRVPGLVPMLQVIGSVLVFMQVGLAVEVMLKALRGLGVIAK
jgi:multiple antibiotic resistance protein